MNLMLNGIEAIKEESGELSVTSTRTEDGELLVAVSDLGIGLPEAGPERIFEAFFTTKPDGTGMGLSISRRIIEFMAAVCGPAPTRDGAPLFSSRCRRSQSPTKLWSIECVKQTWHVLSEDDIVDGIDELGVFADGHAKNAGPVWV